MTRRVAGAIVAALVTATWLTYAPAAAQSQPAGTAVRRLVLIAAANRGGDDRPLLKFALTDADRFSRVLQTLGGVDSADVVLLRQPRVGDLDAALVNLKQRVAAARRSERGGRTEVFFYYSGHADEKGLLLGNDRLSYFTLRERLAAVPADVRIGILDACASGAVTRPKGGKVRRPFTIDESSDMHGQAFLASSSADESAQESDRLGGSFFTHYLISGMRGAADFSGDGRVTLNEAYQFAFNETLSRTVGTRGGPQHPVYDITMSGTGDVIVTDLRQTTAGFMVAAAVEGRFYVLDDRKRLVLEFYKPAGRKVDIGLEPGVYDVRYEREPKALGARVEIAEGPHRTLDLATFGPARLEFTRLRGVDTGPEFLLNGRHMIAMRLGTWSGLGSGEPVSGAPAGFTGDYVNAGRLATSFEYFRFLREDLAVGAGLHMMLDSAESTAEGEQVSLRNRVGVSFPFIVRWNPIRPFTSWRTVEPYVRVGVGPLLGTYSTRRTTGASEDAVTETVINATVGGSVGAGAGIRIGGSWMAAVDVARNYSGRVQELGVNRARYQGWEITFGAVRLLGEPKVRSRR
jgi:hypothetical protein